jgi:hypothetical protein
MDATRGTRPPHLPHSGGAWRLRRAEPHRHTGRSSSALDRSPSARRHLHFCARQKPFGTPAPTLLRLQKPLRHAGTYTSAPAEALRHAGTYTSALDRSPSARRHLHFCACRSPSARRHLHFCARQKPFGTPAPTLLRSAEQQRRASATRAHGGLCDRGCQGGGARRGGAPARPQPKARTAGGTTPRQPPPRTRTSKSRASVGSEELAGPPANHFLREPRASDEYARP